MLFVIMPQGEYKGKRVSLTVMPELYERLKLMAQKENRTVTQMCMTLILEALENRGVQKK